MSERLYREFFLVASEAAAQLGRDGATRSSLRIPANVITHFGGS